MSEKNVRIELSRRAQRDIDDIPDSRTGPRAMPGGTFSAVLARGAGHGRVASRPRSGGSSLDAEFRIIKDDIKRIAAGTFPGEIKMIHALPGKPLQADSGRYRVLCRRSPDLLEIICVFPKKQQSKVFRSLR